MIEKLVPLKLPPGFYHNGTRYESQGRWYDGNAVRWHEGSLQPIGGWRRARAANAAADMAGAGATTTARVIAWDHPSIGSRVVLGTTTGLYAYDPLDVATTLSNITPVAAPLGRSWSFDLFGDTLIASVGGHIYEWAGNLAAVATGLVNDPQTWIDAGVVVTPERFLVALSATSTKNQIKWASQETTSVWAPATTNTAGDFTFPAGNVLCGRRTKGQTLLWTDLDLWSMTYIGGALVFSFRQEGTGCGAMSPSAAVVADGRAYWMGRNGFFVYDGYVRPVPCDVHDKVFGEIDISSHSDFYAGSYGNAVTSFAMPEFNEVWWLYSTSGSTNNRYVAYNYKDEIWHYGAWDRIGGCSSGSGAPFPLLVDSANGYVYEHEYADTRTGVTAYLESGPLEVEDGDRVVRIQRIVPDELTLGQTTMSVYTAMSPTEAETTNGPYTMTQPTDVRLSAKQIRVKITEASAAGWRIGTPRLGVIPQGRR